MSTFYWAFGMAAAAIEAWSPTADEFFSYCLLGFILSMAEKD